MKGPLLAFLFVGGLVFAAARKIWDAGEGTALVLAIIVGGLAYWLGGLKPSKVSSVDLSPQV